MTNPWAEDDVRRRVRGMLKDRKNDREILDYTGCSLEQLADVKTELDEQRPKKGAWRKTATDTTPVWADPESRLQAHKQDTVKKYRDQPE